MTDAGQNTEPAQTSAAESAKDDSESIGAPKGSTSTNESVQSSTGKKPTGNNVDVKTGNKVEPKATTGEHPPKSGDATAATAHDHGTTASSAGGSARNRTPRDRTPLRRTALHRKPPNDPAPVKVPSTHLAEGTSRRLVVRCRCDGCDINCQADSVSDRESQGGVATGHVAGSRVPSPS